MEKLPVASCIFVDRRKVGKGKSIPNRTRLLSRIKSAIKNASPKDIGNTVGGMASKSAAPTNVVNVTRDRLREPTFHYEPWTGDRDIVLIGNDIYERGDEFPLSSSQEGDGGGAGPGEDGEDDFVVSISRDEFLNVFFEDHELPDLQETHEKDLPEMVSMPAGYQKDGLPGQLSVIRSYRNSLPRRVVLQKPLQDELEELEEELKTAVEDRVAEIEVRIAEIKSKMLQIPLFEKMDLRYKKREHVQVKSADAVFVMIMDVSGSMDEKKKTIARKLFALQYAFIKRKYPQTDLIFIAHTDTAEELSEEEFFTTRRTGGTIVSPSYTLAHDIIRKRYNPNDTNIYLSQASDGDNWESDNAAVIEELQNSGLLSKLRHMSYAEIGESAGSLYRSYSTHTLMSVLTSIGSSSKKLSTVTITSPDEVYSAFSKIYKKHTS